MKLASKFLLTFTAFTMFCVNPMATQSDSISPTVQTIHGALVGARLPGGDIDVFRGIRYGQSPIGDQRWRPPVAPSSWTGVRPAQDFGPACTQPRSPAGSIYADYPARMSEDCLFLNVWKPAHATNAHVMVWIHGGSLRTGNLASGNYDGAQLARKGVLVTTLNFRLGALGYLAHPELPAESPHKSSGNCGLLDQIEALGWVRENIARFGGDPSNVTLFGGSAGALSSIEPMTTPLARGRRQTE